MNQGTTADASLPNGHPTTEAPKRIQLSREKGWRLPANTVKVDRSTQWGNPYRIGERVSLPMARRWGWDISPKGQKIVCEEASEAVKRFAHCLQFDEAIHGEVREQLKGRDLACWCPPNTPCHGDVLLALANSKPEDIRAMNDAIDARIIASANEVLNG